MKVGIVSINKYAIHMNYGAALHSYAFQTYLKMNGVESIIIDYLPPYFKNYNFKYPIMNVKSRNIFRLFFHIVKWSIGFIPNLIKYKKFQIFFKNKYIMTNETYHQNDLFEKGVLDKYGISIFVCESDVIWKKKSTGGVFDRIFFLDFPSASEKIKIAYAPSLGSEVLSQADQQNLKRLIASFHAISTRERQGSEYLANLLGEEIPWVLDPTLLLRQEDYLNILERTKEKNYLLIYNCMQNDRQMIREARLLAQKLELKVIEVSIYARNKITFNHKVKDHVGIEEFLGLFMGASFVVCNAFHGLCFSLIFKKEFFLFLRDSTDYRMLNLIESLDLNDRFIHFENKKIPDEYKPIDFPEVDKKLELLRLGSFEFIEKNIITPMSSAFTP